MRLNFGKFSYNVRVTSAELWRRVGRILQERRGSRNWQQIATASGVDPKTIQAIERGEPRRIDKLEAHAGAFKMSLVDILTAVLKETEEKPTPEAVTLLRYFEQLPVADRQLVLLSAQRAFEQFQARQQLESQVAAARSSPAPSPDPPKTTSRKK